MTRQKKTTSMTGALPVFTPGEALARAELHRRYGGRPSPRISMSKEHPVVFLFIDRSSPLNGWQNDVLIFMGEGRTDDQQFTHGNKAVLDTRRNGRVLSVWSTSGDRSNDTVTFAGTFTLADPPHVQIDLPDPSQDGLHRTAIAFRLLPGDAERARQTVTWTSSLRAPVDHVTVTRLDIESTEGTAQNPARPSPYENLARTLNLQYALTLRQAGHRVTRHRIELPGEALPAYTWLYDETTNTLYGCIPSMTRLRVREEIGQLLHLALSLPNPALAMICPSQPRPDLAHLLGSVPVRPVWKQDEQWTSTTTGTP